MKNETILNKVPFLSHLTDAERSNISKKFETISMPAGKTVNTQTDKFYIIKSGQFILDNPFSKDKTFTSGKFSYFGNIPFVNSNDKLKVHAQTDGEVIAVAASDLVKFVFENYKAGRAYSGILENIYAGQVIPEISGIRNISKVVTVTSLSRKSGKTTLAAMLGLALSENDRTIILDMSFSGESVFSVFDKQPSLALTQKIENEKKDESFIKSNIIEINENLALLNISYGSLVAINEDVLPAVIRILARSYKYIITDLEYTKAVYEKLASLTDVIYLIDNKNSTEHAGYNEIAKILTDGQNLVNVQNKCSKSHSRYFIKKMDFTKQSILEKISSYSSSSDFLIILSETLEKKNALCLENEGLESLGYSGLFLSLYENNPFSVISSNYISFIMSAMFTMLSDSNEFKKQILDFFKPERINYFLDIKFPDSSIIKNGKIKSYMSDLSKDRRMEDSKIKLITSLLEKNEGNTIISTGYLKEIMTASFCFKPLFDSQKIYGKNYYCPFPYFPENSNTIYRYSFDKIYHAEIKYEKKIDTGRQILEIFDDYLKNNIDRESVSWKNNLSVKVDFNEYNIDKIVDNSYREFSLLMSKEFSR